MLRVRDKRWGGGEALDEPWMLAKKKNSPKRKELNLEEERIISEAPVLRETQHSLPGPGSVSGPGRLVVLIH